ncbi:phospho-sugar mutase [Nakamurella sp. A5-74]|uniref:Phospho-sugar mutase n=1 Tax=Nakamurella sp. A5-74 TaxID=3158264 RepID=A0AAU8DKL5_9ACTN
MSALDEQVRQAATDWISADVCPADRDELQQILTAASSGNASAIAELEDRMSGPLGFGTAGLRGPLRAGPSGMNLVVMRRAAAGIAAHLRANGGTRQSVVVGHDARHRSREFAEDAANVLSAAGFDVVLSPGPVPTPVTAFAVRHLQAAAGLQVTASHNPPRDNGLKVYLQAGAQLVSPTDAAIEAAIAAAPAAGAVKTDGNPSPWPDDLVDAYRASIAALVPAGHRELRLVTTAMHGVGGQLLLDVLQDNGFTDVTAVASQQDPDPDFPTVTFPNPEEPGATDALLALADELGADLAIANDPDADRCAIGARSADGSMRMLRGDETGVLLGDHVLAGLDRAAHPDPLVATTIVSSSLLGAVAAAHGARYDETLTGFKWIVRAGDGQGTGLVFGYEEALGLCVDPDHVRDKDGISAAAVAAVMAADLKAQGRTVFDALDELAVQHGLHVTDQLSVRVQDLQLIGDVMTGLRAAPPDTLLDTSVSATDVMPRTDAIVLRGNGVRVVVRPSGTEPKLKAYLQVVVPVEGDLPGAHRRGAELIARLRGEVAGVLGL